MKILLTSVFTVLAAAGVTPRPAPAAETDEWEPVRCVNLRSIDRTEVLDDQRILFYMRGDRIYVNRLKHTAPGLKKDQPFMYETISSQLCANDLITVLERMPFGMTRMGSAPLGEFEPIDEDRAAVLKDPDSAADDAVEHVDIE